MNVEIISIGDELLIGQVVNTNAAWMGAELSAAGMTVSRVTTVSDSYDAIFSALGFALQHADVVLLTGGLGPTNDDITKDVLCRFFNTELVLHQETLNHIRELFSRRKFVLTESNLQQAMVPASCTVIPNMHGTAPAMWFEHHGVIVVSMPGVPYEMKGLMTDFILPALIPKNAGAAIVHKTIVTHGVGESWLADKIFHWESTLPPHIKLAYLPRPGMVRLRLSAFGNDSCRLQEEVSDYSKTLHTIIPDCIIGYDNDTMESVVTDLLIQNYLTVSVAESCTGGYIAALLTALPGVSECFLGGVVAYKNEVKCALLNVNPDTIDMQGAVSEAVVIQMAEGVRNRTGSDFAIATSGIAGPGGGTDAKPVGTVWIAVAGKNGVTAKSFFFGGNRERIIIQSAAAALNYLRIKLIADYV
ncbi:MAG: competence/damage-inducible protein A [Candidatus Cloacimonetes bacterium]|nr:competence/damage-inducible protein A [Candidatus Cloacimonadota bacterium]MDD2324273.1 competence/damage-inducible protein A [Bacteroidales bacterium]MDD3961578.1 competence/damage-inducible protein A [Bacteroidales bacterium]MDY0285567.1 competence/damage-inducible protein A [Bacteroidales bacterium]HPE86462.1 competence/damage-inducible protein A [Bacteroidales bacterium]